MSMNKVILFGNGPIATSAYYKLTYDSTYEVAGFTVDAGFIKQDTLFDLPVVPFPEVESIYPPDVYKMIIAVGYVKLNRIRTERFQQAKAMGYELISHVSSSAIVAPGLKIGENCTISTHTIVSPEVVIGNNVIIGAGSLIGHHTVIKENCFIGDHVSIAGGVTIEPSCFLGISSTVRDKLTIARECIIGAGALILQDTQEKGIYMGESAELLPILSDKLRLE
jgi:sugar O-acyltransferase (sialic acid O-acetyltransferase NeuD family)